MRTIGRGFRRPEVRNIMDIAEDNSSIPSSSFQGTMIFDKKARQQQQQLQQLQQHRCSIYSDGQLDKSVPRRYFQKYPSHNEQSGMTSEQRPPVNNGNKFWFMKVVVVHRFDCIS